MNESRKYENTMKKIKRGRIMKWKQWNDDDENSQRRKS